MRVEKREFAREFCQLSCELTITDVIQSLKQNFVNIKFC